ncbi:MAG: acetyltransferase [Phenylobacterium sp.]|nr:acetyltransferase [Phenylobacterium sp.]MDB5493824.1 acetyltransferase [Phenylobacterium sp.]
MSTPSDALEVVDNAAAHRFEISLDGQTAFAEYSLVHGAVILPHTVVPEAFEGKGVGSRLAAYAMQYARDHELKVIPLCPFMAAYMKRHAETHDLVHRLYRERLGLRPSPKPAPPAP